MKTQIKFENTEAGKIIAQMRAVKGVSSVEVSRPFGSEGEHREVTWHIVTYAKKDRTSARRKEMHDTRVSLETLAHTLPGWFGTHSNSGLFDA